MTEHVIADYIEPSEEIAGADGEITAKGLLDEVSLYNLYDDRDSPEQDVEQILRITYPTTTLADIITHTANKLDGDLNNGAHIIGGDYGSGKSHIELVLYHLLDSPNHGEDWLATHGIDAVLPNETRTAALQMLNLDTEYERLAPAVADYLGIESWDTDGLPTVHQIRDAIGDTPTAVFIDELERWFEMAAQTEYQSDNLAFLQNLLEAAGREDTSLCVFVSLLYENPDVESIVQRTNPFTYDLSSRRDEKIQFLLHRLVGKVTDPTGVAELAAEYTNVYRQNDQIQLDDYQQMENRIAECYPFHPELLDLLMEKYSEQRSHQDARGLLRFLTEILSDSFTDTDLILTSNVDVFKYTNWFRFIDAELVGKYLNDYHRLGTAIDEGSDGKKEFDPYIEELMNIVLLHSLARGGDEGANQRQMLLGMMRKGENAHAITETFKENVYGHAWHIHRINGEYAFDTDENPAARIDKKAEDIHKDTAIHRIERLIREDLFNDRNNVYIYDPVNTEQEIPDNKTLKIVVTLSAHRSYDDIVESLTTGQSRMYQNTLVLVTPKNLSGVDTNTGIRELARKVVAGEQLKREEGVLPEGFDSIHDQNMDNLRDRVQDKYGTAYTFTERGPFPNQLTAPDADFYNATLDAVRPDQSQVQSEVKEKVREAGGGGIQYGHLLNDFYRDTSFSTLTDEQDLRDAINTLCKDGVLQVGSYYEQSVGSLGSDTALIHEDHRQTVDDDDDETQTDLETEVTISTETTPTTTTTTLTDDSDDTEESVTESVTAFTCPECGEELESTECDCGFEFDASDLDEGTVSIEGGTTEELIEQFEGLQDTELETKTTRFPAIGALDAGSKPELIDTLERRMGVEWVVHRAELTVEGTVSEPYLETRGITDNDLAGHVSVNETLNFTPETPVSRQAILNLLWSLEVPDEASLEVWMEVEQND